MEPTTYFIAGFEQSEHGKQLWTLSATNFLAAKLAEDMFKQRGFKNVTLRPFEGA